MRESSVIRLAFLCGAAVVWALASCSQSNPARPTSSPDTSPPAAVVDLAAGSPTSSTVTLTWTTPGDDGNLGKAAAYDIRYSRCPINAASWPNESQVTGEPSPKTADSPDTFVVTGLSENMVYYFAVKTADEECNWSSLSNVAGKRTQMFMDTIPPAGITDLATGTCTARSVTIQWTAPGDDGSAGIAARYDIRYSALPITDESFHSAQQVADIVAPKPPGNRETLVVPGLSQNTVYHFAVKTIDDKLNTSCLSNVVSGSTLPCMYCWVPLGSGMSGDGSYDPNVSALADYNGQLIAGGHFAAAGGVSANNIAAWNGRSWAPLGPGIPDSAVDLAVYSGRLIVARRADESNPAPILAWDGSQWSTLAGMNLNDVSALTVYNSQLIAGGMFDHAGSVSANSIAAWNGSSWSELGSGVSGDSSLPGNIYSLTEYNGLLIAGGDFSVAGGFAAENIAAWNGSYWLPLGSGVHGGDNPRVLALAVYNGRLIAGGAFTSAGDVSASNIAAWNGVSWSPLASGTDDVVLSFAVYNSQLIAGGAFTAAGGSPANYAAVWDGSSWSPFGSGMSGGFSTSVRALIFSGGQLIAAGGFAEVGATSATGAALWAD